MVDISGATKIVGIFGYPVEHTLSPVMHNSAFEYLKLDYVYLPFLVKSSELKFAIEAIKALNIVGVNVTIPHKEKICIYLDRLDISAEKVKAVNTVVRKDFRLIGYNTDGIGFVKSLEGKFNLKSKNVLLLGAGGAGRAISWALLENKVRKISIYDIKIDKVTKLVKDIGDKERFEVISSNEVEKVIAKIDLLVNATPVGMTAHPGTSPIDTNLLHKELFVYDIIYNRKTKLIKEAERIGARCLAGIEMLLYQAAASFELWTDRKAPIEIMRKSIRRRR